MLTGDERGKVLAAVRATDAGLADKLTEELSDRGHAVNVARAVASDETMARVYEKAVDTLARFAVIEETKNKRWEMLLGPKGLVALVVGGVITVASIGVSAYLGQSTKDVSLPHTEIFDRADP